MNIAFFADCWYPQINGVITSMSNLEYALSGRGHSVYKFVPRYGSYKDTAEDIFRQSSIRYVFQPEFNVAAPTTRKALKKMREWKIEIIHAHSEFSMGIVASKLAGKLKLPFVFTFHTIWEYYAHYFLWGLIPPGPLKRLIKQFYKKPDYYIVPSIKIKYYLEKNFNIEAPVEVIPTGLKLDHFYGFTPTREQMAAFRKSYGISAHDAVMIFVGRIGREKSIDVIIKALPGLLKKHANIKFLIVGGGPAESSLKKMVKDLRLDRHVIFAGYIPWEDIPLAYKSSDIFVIASTTETQGLVTVEAMASGLPVVAKKDLVSLEILNNGRDGRIFDSNDDFAPAVDSLLSDKKTMELFKKRSLESSKKFTVEKFGKKVERYYRRIQEETNTKKTRPPRAGAGIV